MKRKFIFFTFLVPVLFVLAGCVSVNYRGYTFPETSYVKLYFDKNNITGKYEVIGKATATAPEGYTYSDIYKELVKKGKEVGANAILITDKRTKLIGQLEGTTEDNDSDEPVAPDTEGGTPSLDDGQPIFDNSFGEEEVGLGQAQYEYDTVIKAVFYRVKDKMKNDTTKKDNLKK